MFRFLQTASNPPRECETNLLGGLRNNGECDDFDTVDNQGVWGISYAINNPIGTNTVGVMFCLEASPVFLLQVFFPTTGSIWFRFKSRYDTSGWFGWKYIG